ncbi:hypothetical protein EVAR_24544_1 [Eumeta japonica]|uniref:Uncharacterized protein n=1 Tax=Eumeta variegata TaxID=151549 RepID=A0A4C1UQZ7_EUMVA|nr:hypothetical protein EVAR_24544_1 [Eumeta japonica]
MRSLCSTCGVSRKDRYRNSDVREWCGLKEDAVTEVERGMLRWIGHLERMNESSFTKLIYGANARKQQRAHQYMIIRRRAAPGQLRGIQAFIKHFCAINCALHSVKNKLHAV